MKLGSWIQSCSPIVADVMAEALIDFLVVDCEHSPADHHDVMAIAQAVGSRCETWVRIASHDHAARYLDHGATGIIRANVQTPAEADLLLDHCHYPPRGNRGAGFSRSNKYGQEIADRVRGPAPKVIAQIEHVRALHDLDAICSSGIDGILVGPYDLALSLGHIDNPTGPEVLRVIQGIVDSAKSAGIMAGMHCVQNDQRTITEALKRGFDLVAFSTDLEIIGSTLRDL